MGKPIYKFSTARIGYGYMYKLLSIKLGDGENIENKDITTYLFQQAKANINNMYIETASDEDYWECPVCKTEGMKINEHYGYCLDDKCVGICIAKNMQDIRQTKVRKIENLVIDQRRRKKEKHQQKYFIQMDQEKILEKEYREQHGHG